MNEVVLRQMKCYTMKCFVMKLLRKRKGVFMEYALSVTMAIFALIGAIDKIFGNRLKLGDEFEKGNQSKRS